MDTGNGVHRIDTGASNVYLVVNGSSSLLVDAGRKGGSEKILKEIERNGLDPSDIRIIFLTHTHNDHTGSLKTLKNATGAKLIVHESEARFLRDGFSPPPGGTTLLTRMMISLARGPFKSMGRFDPVKADLVFHDQYDLSPLGIGGKILHTPGHSQGSSILIMDDGNCFVGDTMFNIFPGSVYPPFADDEDLLIRTWESIRDMGITRFLPGHGKPFEREKFMRTLEKKGNERYNSMGRPAVTHE